jgi:hypothetical protein
MRVCTTVFGYAGGQRIIDRHLPVWKSVSDEVILVYPEDSPNRGHGVRHFPTGRSNKYGEECLKRQLAGMRHSLSVDADYYVFVEYDAFLLARPIARSGVQANVFPNRDPRYRGPGYFHFPWIFDAATLRRFAEGASIEPQENGFVDRWLQCQVTNLGIEVHNLRALREGFSRNTLRTRGQRRFAVELARRGGYAFHGIKDAALLRKLLAARKVQR